MKKQIKLIIICCLSAIFVLGSGLTVLAASSSSDSMANNITTTNTTKSKNGVHVSSTSIAASVLGKTEDEVKSTVEADTSLGQQLIDAGKLDEFKTAYLETYKTKLDAAVTAGTLTQTQADEKYTSKTTEITTWDGSTELTKRGKGRGGMSKDSTQVSVIKVAASVLGKTEDEVKEYVKSGKVGNLLIESDKLDAFKTAYLEEAKTKLDAAVTAGTLTQTQADEKYTAAQEKMASYDGTTHLCGGTDHSKMFEKKSESSTSTSDSTNTSTKNTSV